MQLRILLIFVLGACPLVRAPADAGEAAGLQRQALADFDAQVARPTLSRFAEKSTALETAVQTWAMSTEPDALAAAQAAFRQAFVAFQRVEVLQLGPLGPSTRVTLGQGLRDEMYAWPTVNLCRVDAALAAGTEPTDAFFDTALVTSKGLSVLEWLLFHQAPSNSCPATATVNTDGSWQRLADGPWLLARRKAWALGAARHLRRTADRATSQWATFGTQLSEAGQMGSPWRTPKDGLDEVFAGLFAIDRLVKDLKLGGPAGITSACMAQSCPDLAESPLALLSTPAITANLEALRAGLTGSFEGPAVGFDDLLVERGADALNHEMLSTLERAITQSRSLSLSIQAAATTDLDSLHALHASLKAFTDLFKSQFVTTLSLKVPKEGAGDND